MVFNKLFKKKVTTLEEEKELEKNIIENNSEVNLSNTYIITYITIDEDTPPELKIIGLFHAEILPEKDSIIWCVSETKDKLVPYKVIRFDFIEDPDPNINNRIYIVVVPAKYNDIM